MAHVIEKIKNYFTAQPFPSSIFQITSTYLSGISYAPKERKIRGRFILPLEQGVIEPHFEKKNILASAALAERLKDILRRHSFSGEKVACLIPETCFKIFIITFDSLPSGEKENEKLMLWRAKKLMPVMPADARLSYQVLKADTPTRVLVSLARATVIQEYEDLFAGLGCRVRMVSVPGMSLLNVLDSKSESDILVVNIEEEGMSLVAFIGSEMILYRMKLSLVERHGQWSGEEKIENIAKEVETTVHFIEDREKQRLSSIWLRSGLRESQERIVGQLSERLALPIKTMETLHLPDLGTSERAMLLPLLGQIS